jgi:hypothetical protein
MTISPLVGNPAPKEMLADVSRLEPEYFERWPDPNDHASGSVSALAGIAVHAFMGRSTNRRQRSIFKAAISS